MDILLFGLIAAAIVAIAYFLLGKKQAQDLSEPRSPDPARESLPGPGKVSGVEAAGSGEAKRGVEASNRVAVDEAASSAAALPLDSASDATETTNDASRVADAGPHGVPAGSPAGLVDAVSRPSSPTSAEVPPESDRSGVSPLPAKESRPSKVEGLRRGLSRSRSGDGFFGKLKSLFASRQQLDESVAEEIEEILLASDVGVTTTSNILDRLRKGLSKGELKSEEAVWNALRSHAKELLQVGDRRGALVLDARPTVVLLVGVNGAGKTTTIGKLATQLKSEGKTCVLAAGDTFRAAAVQQLIVWGERVGCEVVRGKDGADPGSVIFDAVKRAEAIGADVVLADTAGRLHTKSNLMAEMQKIARTTGKAKPGAPHETLIVIDSTNGQNALAQAREFRESLDLTGVVLTKLDGTAKGGVVLGIADSLGLPVRYVGLGERPDDLHDFVADDFVEALLGKDA